MIIPTEEDLIRADFEYFMSTASANIPRDLLLSLEKELVV